MKNQNDIIVSGIAAVVMLIVVLVSFFTKRDPVVPQAPAPIDTKMPAIPPPGVVLADALPGSSNDNSNGLTGGGRSGGGGGLTLGGPGSLPSGASSGPTAANVSTTGVNGAGGGPATGRAVSR